MYFHDNNEIVFYWKLLVIPSKKFSLYNENELGLYSILIIELR